MGLIHHFCTQYLGAWIEVEIDHNSTYILRGDNVVATILVGDVVSEELRMVLIIDVDTVSGDLDRGERLRGDGVDEAVHTLRRAHGGGSSTTERTNRRGGVGGKSSSQRNREREGGSADLSDRGVAEEGHAMPITVGVLVAGANETSAGIHWVGDIERRAEACEHGLNGPLELGQENVERCDGLILRLDIYTDLIIQFPA